MLQFKDALETGGSIKKLEGIIQGFNNFEMKLVNFRHKQNDKNKQQSNQMKKHY